MDGLDEKYGGRVEEREGEGEGERDEEGEGAKEGEEEREGDEEEYTTQGGGAGGSGKEGTVYSEQPIIPVLKAVIVCFMFVSFWCGVLGLGFLSSLPIRLI